MRKKTRAFSLCLRAFVFQFVLFSLKLLLVVDADFDKAVGIGRASMADGELIREVIVVDA